MLPQYTAKLPVDALAWATFASLAHEHKLAGPLFLSEPPAARAPSPVKSSWPACSAGVVGSGSKAARSEGYDKDPPGGSPALSLPAPAAHSSLVSLGNASSDVSAGMPSRELDATASLHNAAALSVVSVQSSNGKVTKCHLVAAATMMPHLPVSSFRKSFGYRHP